MAKPRSKIIKDLQQDADNAADAVVLNALLLYPEGATAAIEGTKDAALFEAVRDYRAAQFRLARAEGET